MDTLFDDDLAAIARIDVVPTILEVICRTTGMGFSAVSRVTEDHWVACAVRDEINFGLKPGGELQIQTTFCNEIRQSGQFVVIDHVSNDELFREHAIPKQYGFESYISVPIRLPRGEFFGTLCAVDPRPARLNTIETVNTFKLFADLIGLHLDAQQRLAVSESALSDERQRGELQQQFIAVLGHDLRNPLSAVQTGAKVLLATGLNDKAKRIASIIDRSAARMTGMIDNVLDFTRSRLSGKLPINRQVDSSLGVMLDQVVNEMRTAQPERDIRSQIGLAAAVRCDPSRIGQLLSNLLANALTHGEPSGAVRVVARSDDREFVLSVANAGEPIAKEALGRLFQPFERGSGQSEGTGLGLGLYIASEIARAHDGSLQVSSTPEETRFTFTMPSM